MAAGREAIRSVNLTPSPTPAAATAAAAPASASAVVSIGAGDESVEDGAPLESRADSPFDGADTATVWPDEQAEAAFISETRGKGEAVPVASPEVVEEVTKPLPKLDTLVNRIPEETRDLLDELFRAKFVAVRRVKKSDLKTDVK